MASRLTHMQMIERLEHITHEDGKKDRADELSQTSLADSLLMLAELDHEREYSMCRTVAQHLLGEVPEPDDTDLGEI